MPIPYIATIVITGICYMVNVPGGKVVSVVMPNGEHGIPASTASAIPPHYIFIKYLKNQTMPNPTGEQRRSPNFTFSETVDMPGGTKKVFEWAVILLHAEKVTLATGTSSLDINQAKTTPGGPTCTSGRCNVPPIEYPKIPDDRQPYSKIIDRKTACPQCSDIPTAYLTPGAHDSVVGARLDLTDGFLASGAFKKGEKCLWAFRPQEQGGSEPTPRALPQMASLDVRTANNTLTITFQFFDTSTTAPLKLQGSDTSRLVAIIGNAPLSDILGIDPPMVENTDEHFQLYYRLISGHIDSHPIPNKYSAECYTVSITNGNCPPMQQQ